MKRTLLLVAAVAMSITSFAQFGGGFGGFGGFGQQGPQEPQTDLLDAAGFDTIISEKPVALYTISRGDITAQITNWGGYVVSLMAPDKDGNVVNLIPHMSQVKRYLNANCGQYGPALGRFANRIANGKFSIDGVEYQITKNSGQHTLHGGSKGFDHIVWDVVKVKKDRLVLRSVLTDGTDGFPGTLVTTLTYSITKDGGLSISYEATTDKKTVVNLSNHTYFNLNGAGNGDIMGHQLTINADRITETDRSNIPTGKFLDVEGTAYDFRNATAIGDRTVQGGGFGQQAQQDPMKVRNFDNNFVLNHRKAGKIELVATLYSEQSGRKLEVLNNHPGLQVYTGARNAIALESQMFPDSPNHPEFPSTILEPGKTYKHTVIYRFSVVK